MVWINLIFKFEKERYHQREKGSGSSSEEIQRERCVEWFNINGDQNLRLNYDLTHESIVFDVGGFKGEFASTIYSKYGCKIFVFEPLPEYFSVIKERFSNNKNVEVFCAGLSDRTASESISFSGDKSSLFLKSNQLTIQLLRASDFIRDENIKEIHLMKINIEGAEYELLTDLIKSKYIRKIKNIQVQFHDFIVPDAKNKMNKIQEQLSLTHELTYQFEFVWENWKLK